MQSSDRDSFVARLLTFHRRRGTPVMSVPLLLGRPLNVHALYFLVQYRGGFVSVHRSGLWREVAACLVPTDGVDLAAAVLPMLYYSLLLPYEAAISPSFVQSTQGSSAPPTSASARHPQTSNAALPSAPRHLSSAHSQFAGSAQTIPEASGQQGTFRPTSLSSWPSASHLIAETAHVPPFVPQSHRRSQTTSTTAIETTTAQCPRPSAVMASICDVTDATLAHIFGWVGRHGDVRDMGRLCMVSRRFRRVVLTHPASAQHARCPPNLIILERACSLAALCRPPASNGVASAQVCLAFLLHMGWSGVHKDSTEALHWASIAAATGDASSAMLVAAIRQEVRETSLPAS